MDIKYYGTPPDKKLGFKFIVGDQTTGKVSIAHYDDQMQSFFDEYDNSTVRLTHYMPMPKI